MLDLLHRMGVDEQMEVNELDHVGQLAVVDARKIGEACTKFRYEFIGIV